MTLIIFTRCSIFWRIIIILIYYKKALQKSELKYKRAFFFVIPMKMGPALQDCYFRSNGSAVAEKNFPLSGSPLAETTNGFLLSPSTIPAGKQE